MKMALIKCPECGKEISDKASSCPNCGCPIETDDNGVRWHEDNNEERLIMRIDNNPTLYVIGVIFLIALVILLAMTLFSDLPWFLWGIYIVLAISYIPLILSFAGRDLYFTNKRLVGKVGIFFDRKMDVPLDMITSVTIDQGLCGDTLTIAAATGEYKYAYIDNATKFQQALLHQVGVYKKNY